MALQTPDPPRLPQPGWRLVGFTSIGLGAGLFSADVPFVVLAGVLLPALIAMVVIAVQSTVSPTIAERANRAVDEFARRR